MQIVYVPLAEKQRDAFVREHPRGADILRAIESDLSRDPVSRATELKGGRHAQIFTPDVDPPTEIRIAYLVGNQILIKVFQGIIF